MKLAGVIKSVAFITALLVLFNAASAAPRRDERKGDQSQTAKLKKNDRDSAHSKTSARNERHSQKPVAKNTGRDRNSKPAEKIAKKESRKEVAVREKRERLAELRRAEQKRRAETERLAAIERERERDEALRSRVQTLIARDDLSGEDPEVRQAAVNALGDHAGTVVVMNPQTGRIYSMVNQEWAVREGFKPCSTIKLVTALAGLNENVIDPADTTRIADTNQLSLTRALAYSKNGYFQQVGEEVGFEKMLAYARRLGLGEKTGINARNEFQGTLPTSAARENIHRMSSHGDNFEVTPLQLATLVSAMANGGKLLTPYIVRSNHRDTTQKPKVRRQVNLNSEAWRQIVPGMVGAVNYGSGRKAHDPSQIVAGKTGTCIEGGAWVGLFTSYAPLANPKLAVVVITRGADARSHFPAAVAGRIYRELGGRFGTPSLTQVAARQKPVARGELEEEDDEEASASEQMERNVAKPLVHGASSTDKLKRVMLPVEMGRPSAPSVTTVPNGANGLTRPRRVMTR